MRKEEYIREVVSRIENKKARREVEKELSAHIDDRISYYTDAGWDEETANVKAMEHMGTPEKVAEQMGILYTDNPVEGVLYMWVYGFVGTFIWGIVNFLFSFLLSFIVPAISQASMLNEKDGSSMYLVCFIIVSALNAAIIFVLYRYGKKYKLTVNPILGFIMLIQTHIFIMIVLFSLYVNNSSVLFFINWWTELLTLSLGERIGFIDDLYSVAWFNIALTFIPYFAFYAGMVKKKYSKE